VASASFSAIPGRSLIAGSVELLHEAQGALLASDVAVVVVEPEVERALTISSLLRFLDQHQIPHMIFINKMDTATRGYVTCCGIAIGGPSPWCSARCRCAGRIRR